MTVRPADLLFAIDTRNGLPATVGGEPSFSRGGAKWVRDRAAGGGVLYTRRIDDQAPFGWVEVDGVLAGRRALVLEDATDPLVEDSADLQGSGWPVLQGTVASVASVFGGDFDATHHTNDSGTFVQVTQDLGTFSGNRETFSVILEEGNTSFLNDGIGVRDGTDSVWAIFVDVDFDAETATIAQGSGTVTVERLTNRGPNGGKVLRFHLTYDARPAGNSRSVRPVRLFDGNDVIFHHCQADEQKFAYSAIPYTGASPTTAAEELRYPVGFGPQDLIVYSSIVEAGSASGEVAPRARGIWNIGSGTATGSTTIQLRGSGAPGSAKYTWQINDDNGDWHSVSPGGQGNLLGRMVELACILDVTGSEIRLASRVDRGAAASSGPDAIGPVSDEWTGEGLALGRVFGSFSGREHHLRHLIVPLSAVDAAVDGTESDALLDELSDVPVAPHMAGHPQP